MKKFVFSVLVALIIATSCVFPTSAYTGNHWPFGGGLPTPYDAEVDYPYFITGTLNNEGPRISWAGQGPAISIAVLDPTNTYRVRVRISSDSIQGDFYLVTGNSDENVSVRLLRKNEYKIFVPTARVAEFTSKGFDNIVPFADVPDSDWNNFDVMLGAAKTDTTVQTIFTVILGGKSNAKVIFGLDPASVSNPVEPYICSKAVMLNFNYLPMIVR